ARTPHAGQLARAADHPGGGTEPSRRLGRAVAPDPGPAPRGRRSGQRRVRRRAGRAPRRVLELSGRLGLPRPRHPRHPGRRTPRTVPAEALTATRPDVPAQRTRREGAVTMPEVAVNVDIDYVAPRHLAGGGDPAWITVPLHRACGWSYGHDPLMPRVLLSSP